MLKIKNVLKNKTLFSLHEIISEMIRYGISINLRIVNMDSFSCEEAQDIASDIYRSDDGYAFYYITLATPEKLRLLHAELKLYFHSEKLEKIGIGVPPGIRISSIVRNLRSPSVVFFEEDFKSGALVFDNDFMLQFSHQNPRHSDFMLTEIQTPKSENFQCSNRDHCTNIFPISIPFQKIKLPLTPKSKKRMGEISLRAWQ